MSTISQIIISFQNPIQDIEYNSPICARKNDGRINVNPALLHCLGPVRNF